MKYKLKITIILLAMFVLTQLIGVAVLHADPLKIETEINGTIQEISNPYLSFIEPPEPKTSGQFAGIFSQLILAFIIAIFLLFFLMKFKIKFFLKIWFFLVVVIALFLSFLAFEKLIPLVIGLETALIIALALAIPLAFIKIYKQNFLVHNFTELLIYPGIAVVFVRILNFWTILILLILISIYDIWAVWHSGIMQKMAKYQINKLKIFSGFFVPYVSKKVKLELKKMKPSELKKKKIKVNIAILGGGDVIFPIIAMGVIWKTKEIFLPWTNIQIFQGGFIPALFVIAGATLGLSYLFFFAEKKKFYPAMPFITAGIFAGMIASWIIL